MKQVLIVIAVVFVILTGVFSIALYQTGPTVKRSFSSERYAAECVVKCKEKYNQDLDWVGTLTGDCYCK